MEECVRCKEVDEDRRTLWMSCFYEMNELDIPFHEIFHEDKDKWPRKFYTMRVCKTCRSEWLLAIRDWFLAYTPPQPSIGTGIYIREFGANKEITMEEWNELQQRKAEKL